MRMIRFGVMTFLSGGGAEIYGVTERLRQREGDFGRIV